MATGGGPSLPSSAVQVTSLTDCAGCKSLCLGPVILPCGHVICRRCLHDVLEQQGHGAACQECGQCLDLPSTQGLIVSQIVQQMGTDPVVEHLVSQELEKDTDIRCLHCPNKQADNVCLDCQEYYCHVCSEIHRRSRATKDHVVQLLPQSLQNAPSAATATLRPQSPSALSVTSLDSIRNLPGDSTSYGASRSKSEDMTKCKQWVRKEVGLLQQASSEQQKVETTLQDIVYLGQQLLDRVHTRQQVLDTYQRHLPGLDISHSTNPSTYVVNVRSCAASMAVKTESLDRRLCDVRKCGQCPSLNAVQIIRTQVSQLLLSPDQEATIRSTSSLKSTTSSLTSSHLPSPSHPAAPTFTPSVDIMQTTPQEVFRTSPRSADDKEGPFITDIICLPDDRLVMVDRDNQKVKVMGMTPPHTLSASLYLPQEPCCLAVLPDGVVAVTTETPVIYLLRVMDKVKVSSRIKTVREYRGVGGCSDGQLIVSCGESATWPAAVDILTRQGQVVRTVTDSTSLTHLDSPSYICTVDNRSVLVSDWGRNRVYKIDINTGQVTDRYRHKDIDFPRGVCVDTEGNMFVASNGGHCVCVRNRGGQWGTLPDSLLYSGWGHAWPCGVCVTGSGWLVVTLDVGDDFNRVVDGVVAAYKWT